MWFLLINYPHMRLILSVLRRKSFAESTDARIPRVPPWLLQACAPSVLPRRSRRPRSHRTAVTPRGSQAPTSGMTRKPTRRLRCRPSAVALSAIGRVAPKEWDALLTAVGNYLQFGETQ